MAKKKKLKTISVLPRRYDRPGQPTKYTDELAKEICERISKGELLIRITELDHMPTYTTVMNWVLYNEEFFVMYARARAAQADRFAEECIEMADEAVDANSAQAARVKVDTRKWYTAKIRPRFYGDNGTGFERAEKTGGGNSIKRLIDNLKRVKKREPERS